MKFETLLFACLSNIVISVGAAGEGRIYQEKEGLVIMEAENTPSPLGRWQKEDSINGHSGSGYLEFTGNDYTTGPADSPLEYSFRIHQDGLYYLHLHAARETKVIEGETRDDVANDCYVRVEGDFDAGPEPGDRHGNDAPLELLKSDTKFFGGRDQTFVWASGNHLDPGGHGNKRVAVYRFKSGETYKLVVSGRSKAFKLDRVAFRHTSVHFNDAQNLGARETIAETEEVGPDHAYDALSDFPNFEDGAVPFYKDRGNKALAIRANIVEYRKGFASASRRFGGETGSYDVTLTTLTEEDGESTYRFLVNEKMAGTYVNTHIGAGSALDMEPETHTWKGIAITHGDTIVIEANAATNGEIPEGDGTAWARGRWRQLEFTGSKPLIVPPAGRLAIVADGNSPDPDDIGATAVVFGLLKATGLNDRLVHLSHSCDLKLPFNRISVADEERRQMVLHQLCADGISLFGPFENLMNYFNCRTDQNAAVEDLKKAINASSANDPLWIVEAGEPDIIVYALQGSESARHQHVHVISHHPANDNSGDFFTWKQLLDFGVTEHQIGDQNVGLQSKIDVWDWAKDHANPGIAWIWKQLEYAERDGVVKFQSNKFDCSDAGMLYWWITGADQGSNRDSTPVEIKEMLLLEGL